MARGGRVLRRRVSAPADGFIKTGQPRAILRQPGSCVTAVAPPMPCEAEVLQAVASLYKDELRPYSRILRKRLVEHVQEAGAKLWGKDSGNKFKDCDAGKLRALCEASMYLRVETEDWGEWSAFLVDREPNFIDIYDPVDNYPEELWTAAEYYFKSLGESNDLSLAGGRYVSARALAQRRLPFLEGYSLGQICHITQLAISQRKLLGYFNGAIVPYERSTSMLKCTCAEQQRPLVSSPVSASPDGPIQFQVADLGTARVKLREILDSALLRGTDQVPLSNIKRLFRSLYQMELSETALGHSKLTELLQDPRFSDICAVQLQDRGYCVVPVYQDKPTPVNENCVALVTDIPQVTPRSDIEEQERLNASKVKPQHCNLQAAVQAKVVPPLRTPSPPRTPTPRRMIRRSLTMPDELGAGKQASYHRSLDDSGCSTARGLTGESDSVGYGVARGLSRMDSDISEDKWVHPQSGAGAELRARLQHRLFKAEGRI